MAAAAASSAAAATIANGRRRAMTTSLVAGMALCWARGLGEFGATLVFAAKLLAAAAV